MALYSEKVMDHFRNPRNVGVIEDANGIGEVGNAKCGDIMKMYLKIENDIITDVKFETFGSWTLQAQGELLEPLQTTGPAGTHTVRFALKPNTTDVQRTDTLLLTSRGVTDKIPVVQLPRKK